PKTPLLIKAGHISDPARLRTFLNAINGIADGITLVNCIVRAVLHRDGRPAFGEMFRKVGVLGRTIHHASVETVRQTSRIVKEEGWKLAIAAVGGAARAAAVQDVFAAGADGGRFGSAPVALPGLHGHLQVVPPAW